MLFYIVGTCLFVLAIISLSLESLKGLYRKFKPGGVVVGGEGNGRQISNESEGSSSSNNGGTEEVVRKNVNKEVKKPTSSVMEKIEQRKRELVERQQRIYLENQKKHEQEEAEQKRMASTLKPNESTKMMETLTQLQTELSRLQTSYSNNNDSGLRPRGNNPLLIDRTSSLHTRVSNRLLEDRQLKETQDLEYQQALEEDIRKKNEKEQLKKQQEEQKLQEERELLQKQEEEAQRAEMRYARSLSLAPEPTPEQIEQIKSNGGSVVKLRFRLPEGQNLDRIWNVDDTKLEHLWYFLEGSNPEVDFLNGKSVLVSQFPKQSYTSGESTLRECKLDTPMQLFVESVS
eukprot:TRINITY_DN8227_c0_g1_i1.p1 TRINITY_DN8227_c0_g1~~TRINITY_DN8227_c0_g1_i1.p1  ORF type:complete len:345 (+),score=113.13 TRINITY_DN8227_c0_g1_i1:43-1077(+)